MLQHLREAEALSERLGDDLRRGEVCAFMATVLSTFDDLDAAIVAGNRAFNIAQHLDNLKLRILAASYLAQSRYYQGEYRQVVEFAKENLALLPADWVHEYFGMAVPASIFGRAWLVLSLAELGRFGEARRFGEEAIELAEPTQHPHTVGWAHFPSSILHVFKGDWVPARRLLERCIKEGLKLQGPYLLPWALSSSAYVLAQVGESREALRRLKEAQELLKRQADREIGQHRSWAYGVLGRTCFLLGRIDEARQLGQLSLESSQRHPGFKAHALHLLADISAHSEGSCPETSIDLYCKALALAEPRGMRPLIAHCRFNLGKLYHRIGRTAEAQKALLTAVSMYKDMEMDFWLEREAALLEELNLGFGASAQVTGGLAKD